MTKFSFLSKPSFIWKVFAVFIAVVALSVILAIAESPWSKSLALRLALYSLPVFLLFLHSILVLSFRRAVFFIVLASTVGFFSEIWSLKAGTVFGGHYVYDPNQIMFFSVPISVIFFWAVFIYSGYNMTNAFLSWLGTEKPSSSSNRNWKYLPLLVISDSLIVLSIDLLVDPIQIRLGAWRWLDPGPFFGVPIGNFVGWFVVAAVASAIFRLFEYFFPSKENFEKTILLAPVLGYGALFALMVVLAQKLHLMPLVFLGIMFIIIVVGGNLWLYKHSKKL